jgi:hypothetical protein
MTIENAAQKLSSFLFSTDPVGTCCVENDLYDEYDFASNLLVTEHVEAPLDADDIIEFFENYFEYEGLSIDYAQQVIDVINSNK